ncbi:MAG: protoporphyrinogen oxidase [Bacteroidota bacterium]|nr:protoporphyrinogen oxidase [Bacteroidota bacterium]MDP4236235.1 protoporphyrinogen oxidase [Bacteroidota bacterium]
MNSIGIVGGGITGLVTAYRLKRDEKQVTLYEASSRPGGPVQSIRLDGYLAEFGPNTLLETSTAVSSLVHDLGLESRRLYASDLAKNRFIVRGGKPVALPSSPPSFIRSPLFSFGAKLRLLGEPFIAKFAESREESVADFVRRRLGSQFLDYAIDPFVAGVYAGDPEKLSVSHAFPKLHALEQKYGSLIKGQIKGKKERRKRGDVAKDRARMFSFDEGLQVLIDALQTDIGTAIKLNTSVTKIEHLSEGWKVTYIDNGIEYINTHSALVLTIPAYRLAEILQKVGGIDLSSMKDIYYPPVTSLALGFKRGHVTHPLDGFGMLVPRKEPFHILGTLFSSTLFPGRAPSGHVLLTNYIGGSRSPGLGAASESEQIEVVLKDLHSLLGVHGEPDYVHRAYFPKAIPQYALGYGKYKTLLDSVEAKAVGIFFAGNYRNGISLSDCITSAENVAAKVAQLHA